MSKQKEFRDAGKELRKEVNRFLDILELAEEAPAHEALFGEKPELREELITALPRFLRVQLQLASSALEHLESLPSEELEPILRKFALALDGAALGRLANSYFHLSRRLWKEDGSLLREAEKTLVKEFLGTTDFGLLRKATEVKLEGRYPVWESLATQIVGDPIIFANLATTLPPLINHFLRLFSAALSRIELPSEILASATFNLLQDIRMEELGLILNNLGKLINSLHEGNLILGKSEPRFRQAAKEMAEGLFSTLDAAELLKALVALSEDLEVLFFISSDIAVERPELLLQTLSSLLDITGSLLRGASYAAEKVYQLPPQFFREAAGLIEERVDLKELGRLLSLLLKLQNQILEEKPDLIANSLAILYGAIDEGELKKAMREIAQQSFAFLARQEDLGRVLKPGEAGRILNELIKAYNRALDEHPGKIKDYLASLFSEIESDDLARAVERTSSQAMEALISNPRLAKKLMGSIIASCWKTIKGYAGILFSPRRPK